MSNIDQLYKQKLERLKIEPSTAPWDKICKEIPKRRKRNLFPYKSIAASVAILLTLTLYYRYQHSIIQKIVTNNDVAIESTSNINEVNIIETHDKETKSLDRKNIGIKPLASQSNIKLSYSSNRAILKESVNTMQIVDIGKSNEPINNSDLSKNLTYLEPLPLKIDPVKPIHPISTVIFQRKNTEVEEEAIVFDPIESFKGKILTFAKEKAHDFIVKNGVEIAELKLPIIEIIY